MKKSKHQQLEDLIDQFYTGKPLKNAGKAFPSLILYLRDNVKFNLCFKRMIEGLSNITGFKKQRFSGSFFSYYNYEVNKLKEDYKLIPEEIDIVLCVSEKEKPKPENSFPENENETWFLSDGSSRFSGRKSRPSSTLQ